MVVDYAVTLAVDGAGVSNEQLDYLTLQSNRVENSYQEVNELPTVVYTITEIKNFGTEALHRLELESGETTTAELSTHCNRAHARTLFSLIYSYLFNWRGGGGGGGVTGNALAESCMHCRANVHMSYRMETQWTQR